MWESLALPYKELDGLSKELLADHHKLYTGYIKRLKKVYALLEDLSEKPDRNEYQRLVIEEGFLRNAIRLHELYFTELTPGGEGTPEDVEIGDVDALLEALALTALGSTGWAVLAVDVVEKVPFVFSMKEHSQGYVAQAWPILVLDAYEHAYMRQYGLNKEAYLDAFFHNVDWKVVADRTKQAVLTSDILTEMARR